MNTNPKRITVFYDGACPSCVKDRCNYEKLAGKAGDGVVWYDITGKDSELRSIGIDPKKALEELHVKDQNDIIYSEIDAYILLMDRVVVLKPFAWLLRIPPIHKSAGWIYRKMVRRRLTLTGRR